MEKRELAFNLYKDSKGEKPLKDIALEVEASPGTVRGWKSRYKWDELIGKSPPEKERNVAKEKRSATRNVAAQPVIENDDLTEQQKMFCLFYLQHFNATKAYQQAYQVDYQTANAIGYRLLVNDGIKQELHRLKAELQQDTFVDVKDLIQEYVKQAFADISEVVTSDRKRYKACDAMGKPLKDENGEQIYHYYNTITAKNTGEFDGQLVKEITQGRDGVSVKLYDKQKAMSELMKYYEKSKEEGRQSRRVVITRPKRGDPVD